MMMVISALIILFIILDTNNHKTNQEKAMNSEHLVGKQETLAGIPLPVTAIKYCDFT